MDDTTCGHRLVPGHTQCAVACTARATAAGTRSDKARSDQGSSDPQVDQPAAPRAVPRRRLACRPAPHRRFPPAPTRRRRARQPQDFRLDRLRRSQLLRRLRLRRAARPDARPPVQTRGHHERRPGRRLLRYLPLRPAIDPPPAGPPLDPADPNYGGRAEIGVVRVQREFGRSNAGLLLTDRQFGGSYNRVASLDTRIKLNETWTFTGQVMTSQTRDLDGTQSGGPAYNFDLFHQNRNWLYDVNFIDRSEGFHTDLGYVPRVNMRQAQQFYMRRFHPKSKRVLVFAPNISLLGNLDHHGVQQDWRVNPAFNLQMPRSTYMFAGITDIFERFQNINFRRHDASVFFHTEYLKRATLDLNYSAGTRINYTPAAGLAPFLANGNELQATLTLRPVARLKIDQIYYLTRMHTARTSVFVNHLTRTRANYQFTRALSLRCRAVPTCSPAS